MPKAIRVLSQKTLMLVSRYFFFMLGVKVKLVGTENIPTDNKCVYMVNHQSIMDILLIYGYLNRPMGMLAKKELVWTPVIGLWIWHLGSYFLDRKAKPDEVKALFAKVAKNVNEGFPALIYPEGTRSKGPKNTDFKSGSIRLAIMSEAPIVPITLNGSWKIMHGQKGVIKGAKVAIVVGKAIDSKLYGKAKQKELTEAVQQAVESGFTGENEPDSKNIPFEAKYS
ncbi:MAG: 1-acyl-sn-glycerol-3-phosphate acyltransferase [Spirochaetaceae bacterium]|nr:1-acyl-sn-glycerol-3-phosphate acyltransferase [Spirochaetaceae bacterium]